jgi:hypothetical protein
MAGRANVINRRKERQRPSKADAWDWMVKPKMAKCHPDRVMDRKVGGLCVECALDAKNQAAGTVRPNLLAVTRVPGVLHHCLSVSPDRCPKCQGFVTARDREIRCINCGATFYMVSE